MSKAYNVVRQFEETIAEYAGSKYAVAVESCTAAIFLSLMYRKVKGKEVSIPKHTYPSVPCSIIHAGGKVKFTDQDWTGIYELAPFKIIDSAIRFKKDMYIKDTLYCLSFHSKKKLAIGRGGMILTDSEEAYKWFKTARFDGRPEADLNAPNMQLSLGWNMYMMPEQAARGLQLFDMIKHKDDEDLDVTKQGYPDLSKHEIYTNEFLR